MKGVLATVLMGTQFFMGTSVRAEDAPKVNEFLMPKMEEVLRNSMRVLGEDEGVVTVSLMAGHSLVKDATVLFFRKKHSRLEMIANGKVLTEEMDPKLKQMVIRIELDKDTVIKYPHEGDFGAPMADPMAAAEGNKKDENDYLIPDEDKTPKENDRPGYIEGGLGLLYGQLSSTTSSVANGSKASSSYRFTNGHFAYFSHFIPFGIEFDAHSGRFPTSTYYQKVVSSNESVSVFSIDYRFRPIFNKKLEFAGKLSFLSDAFNTDNTDENLLATKTSGMGFGVRAVYNFEKPDWKPEKKRRIDVIFQSLTLDASYYPMLQALDTGVSRGTDSPGSTGLQYRASATLLAYIDYIPVVKRFFATGSVGVRSYSLKFSGPVTLENIPSPVAIPEGTHATERELDVRFVVGVRFEDPILLMFGQKEKSRR